MSKAWLIVILFLSSLSAQAYYKSDFAVHMHCRNPATKAVFNMWLSHYYADKAAYLLDSTELRQILGSQGTKVFSIEGVGDLKLNQSQFHFVWNDGLGSSLKVEKVSNGTLLTYLSTRIGYGNGTPSTFLFNKGECAIAGKEI